MAKEASKAEPQKKGWFSNLFAAKPAAEVLGNVAKDLIFSVAVSDTGEAAVTISGEASAVSKFSKALKGEEIAFADGKKRGSIVITGEAALAKLTEITDKVRNTPKGINFMPLRDRATEEAMTGLTDREMFALRNQNDPTLGMLSSIIKLAVRDKQEAIGAAKAAAPAPKPSRVDKPGRAAPAAPVAEETDFSMNNDLRIRSRSGPNGGIVLAVPQHLSDEDWVKGIQDIRNASADSGLISVQRYQSPSNPDNRGYIVAGLDADKLLKADEATISPEKLQARIRNAVKADKLDIASAFPEPEKVAAFGFPKEFDEGRKQQWLEAMQAAFGEEGEKYITGVRGVDGKLASFKIAGATRDELTDGGKQVGNKALLAKLTEMADAIRAETPIADKPDLDKSVAFLFPKDLPHERRDRYVEELQGLYAEHGDKLVRNYRSRNDMERTGIKIIGVSKDELMGEGEKSVGNKVLVERLQSIMQRSNAEVVPANEPEAATGTVSLDATANDATLSNADMVKDFMADVRSQLVAYEVARKEIRATKTDDEALAALQDLAQSRQTNVNFPKDSKMIVIRDTRKGQDEMVALRDALNDQGFKASVVGVTNLYIDLTPGHEGTHAARLAADGSADRSPEDTLRQLLGTAFKPGEVDQMVGEYSKRNMAVQVSKDWL